MTEKQRLQLYIGRDKDEKNTEKICDVKNLDICNHL